MLKKINLFLLLSTFCFGAFAKPKPSNYYELRIYHCENGKLPDLLNRFRNHTTALFEKHGMQNIAYWTPTKENNNDLYYILSYPDKESRDVSWKAFMADPEWQSIMKKSEENGKIISSIDSKFMTLNKELTKKINFKKSYAGQVFEMRTYYMHPNRYPNIVARFRDHTRKIFENHGMKNVMYFDTIEKDGEQPLLLYFLAHDSEEAAKKSWTDFGKDPQWIKVRDESEVSGKIVIKVDVNFMKATDFSKIK